MKRFYGLWLQPEDGVYQTLRSLIEELAENFSTPVFEPHVTLVGSSSGLDDKEFAKIAEQISENSHPFQIQLNEPGLSSSYYQNVFFPVEMNPELLELRMKFHEFIPKLKDQAYFPHLSLAYGYQTAKQRFEILEYLKDKDLELTFEANHMVINSMESQDTNTWKIESKFSFNPKS